MVYEKQFLTVSEFAQQLRMNGIKLSDQMVRRHLNSGGIKGLKDSLRKRMWKIPSTEVANYLKNNC